MIIVRDRITHDRSAGMDISKRDVKVCVRVRVPGSVPAEFTSSVTTWGAMTNEILELRKFLKHQHVTTVVMEATSDYWKPFYYLMEDILPVMLVNAKNARNIPGRKTDVSDAMWLAELAGDGLLRPSFIPPPPIRELRDLTRTRALVVRDRSREIQRLEKFLESAGIKLSSVVTNLTGVSSRAMLDALVAGERDPRTLATLAQGRLKPRIPELVEALNGRFGEHHVFLTRDHLEQIDAYDARIEVLTARINEKMKPFLVTRELLVTIPGVSILVADVIIAETGGNMDVFPSAAQLASWAGVCPSSNESAGRKKSTRIQPGNKYLKGALGTAALSASRSQNTYLSAKYRRIASRRTPLKAIVAVEHSILIAVWNMLAQGVAYNDPGADYFTKLDPLKTRNKAIHQLESLGYEVVITPIAA